LQSYTRNQTALAGLVAKIQSDCMIHSTSHNTVNGSRQTSAFIVYEKSYTANTSQVSSLESKSAAKNSIQLPITWNGSVPSFRSICHNSYIISTDWDTFKQRPITFHLHALEDTRREAWSSVFVTSRGFVQGLVNLIAGLAEREGNFFGWRGRKGRGVVIGSGLESWCDLAKIGLGIGVPEFALMIRHETWLARIKEGFLTYDK